MRADSPRFCLHRHLHYCERRCVYGGNGRAGKQQREDGKTVGTTYFSASRYSNSAILAHKRHNPVHLLRTMLAHDLQCRHSAGKVQIYLHTASI
ncbi:unknown [Prevotella sp. CAG:5226]|nr:unknown [Prevotella sp. CAG:5226]